MTLDPLATVDDLEARAAVTLDDDSKIDALLRDASAAVRDAAFGQEFTAGTKTDQRVKIRNGIVRLPQRPVTAVTAVKDENDNALEFTWLGDDRVRLANTAALNAWELEPYRNPLGEVLVTYAYGYETGALPDLLVAITCNVALRALGRDPRDGALVQESVEGYSYQTGSIGAAGPVGLLPEEKLRLGRFARPHGPSRQGV